MRAPLVVIVACIATSVVRSVRVFADLPGRMLSHFAPNGHADGSMARTDFFTVHALFGLGTLALLLSIPALVRSLPPQVVNVPNRDYWLAAEHPDRRRQLQDKITIFSRWLAAALALLFTCVLELVLRANLAHGRFEPFQIQVLLACFAFAAIASPLWLLHMFRVPLQTGSA
jgi:uncharacterized membrane protein